MIHYNKLKCLNHVAWLVTGCSASDFAFFFVSKLNYIVQKKKEWLYAWDEKRASKKQKLDMKTKKINLIKTVSSLVMHKVWLRFWLGGKNQHSKKHLVLFGLYPNYFSLVWANLNQPMPTLVMTWFYLLNSFVMLRLEIKLVTLVCYLHFVIAFISFKVILNTLKNLKIRFKDKTFNNQIFHFKNRTWAWPSPSPA